MRYAITAIPRKGGRATASAVCTFVRQCRADFETLTPHSRELVKKQRVTVESLHKIEDGGLPFDLIVEGPLLTDTACGGQSRTRSRYGVMNTIYLMISWMISYC